MKTVVLYHSADFDGLFCREIARKFLPDAALIGLDYGDPVPTVPEDVTLYMLDISVDGLMNHPQLIWIDHHKSAMEKYGVLPGLQIDGVAACRLAWQWFAGKFERPKCQADRDLMAAALKGRMLFEPRSVQLAGEYDIWDKRDPDAELFQHGLRSRELTNETWRYLLADGNDAESRIGAGVLQDLLNSGQAIQYSSTQQNASIITAYGFTAKFEGLTFLACNHARFNSHLFTAGILPEHDALLGFNYDGSKGDWRISLYHAPGKEHHDLSKISVKFAGGGHRGACGFRLKTLPFLA